MNLDKNVCRLIDSYGIIPKAVCAMIADIKDKSLSCRLKYTCLVMNRFKLFSYREVDARKEKMQHQSSVPLVSKINIACIQENESHIMSVYGTHGKRGMSS